MSRVTTVRLPGLAPFPIEVHGRRDKIISAAIRHSGHWEKNITMMFMRLLERPVEFIDIGANIGWYTLVAGHLLAPDGRVHSFEPDPVNLKKLRANVARNRLANVTVNDWALADREGTERLFLSGENLGDHRLFDSLDGRISTVVAVGRLDDYVGIDPGRPLVIKMDVQGGELRVLSGAQRVLSDHPNEVVILAEIWSKGLRATGGSVEDFVRRFGSLGFHAAVLSQHGQSYSPISWDQLIARQALGVERDPEFQEDLLLFRRLDGIAGPLFALRRP